jgi:hypothetical protein
MIDKFCYSNSTNRSNVINYLAKNNFSRVIDIGMVANDWSSKYVTHYVDLNKSTNNSIGFYGNVCLYSTWMPILDDVLKNGLFDFVICSHVLEDIASPHFLCEMISKIGKEGFISVPSKNIELKKIEGEYYGYIHHRWIFNVENNEFVGYPKLNFLEYIDFSELVNKFSENINDLSFFWKEEINLKIVNDDYMGPNVYSVISYYNNLHKE